MERFEWREKRKRRGCVREKRREDSEVERRGQGRLRSQERWSGRRFRGSQDGRPSRKSRKGNEQLRRRRRRCTCQHGWWSEQNAFSGRAYQRKPGRKDLQWPARCRDRSFQPEMDGSRALAIQMRNREARMVDGVGLSLFIDNLHREVDVKAMRWLLRGMGRIGGIRISQKRRANNGLAFAIVKLASIPQIKKAVGRLHGRTFMGNKIFVRQAKYEAQSSKECREQMSAETGGKNEHTVTGNGNVRLSQAPAADKVGGGPGGGDNICVDSLEDDVKKTQTPINGKDGVVGDCGDGLTGGASMEEDGTQVPDSDDQKVFLCVGCGSRVRYPLPEKHGPCSSEEKVSPISKEGKEIPKVENSNLVSDINRGFLGGGPANTFWSSVPYCLWYPVAGYWIGYPTLGCDQPGWWSQPQGWGVWPFYSSTSYHDTNVQQPPPPTLPNVRISNDDVNRNPGQRSMGADVRAPVSIRQPFNGKVSGPDPVMEDIVNKSMGGMEEDAQYFDKLGNDVYVGLGPGHNENGSGDFGLRPGSEYGGPQAHALEEDLEDVGLRSLFEEPEFPPGFEPAEPSIQEDEPDADPEEKAVKEEARKTLIFAKRLGCTVPNEKLTLSNYEEIIRKQRSNLNRTDQVETDESIEESDRCSRSTTNDKGKRARGTRPLGFSKFSRVSKVAMRGKKKAK